MRSAMTSLLRAARVAILTFCLLVAAVLVWAPPAHAAEPTIALRPGGALHARGAAIVVEATYSCPSSAGGPDVSVRVTQRQADGSLVGGSGMRAVLCTDTATTRRFAASSAHPFYSNS